jgi:transposase
MRKTQHVISNEQAMKIREYRKRIQDKQVDKRLRAVQLQGEGKSNAEIAEQLETVTDVVSRWICKYVKGGIDALLPKERKSSPRNMSYEEEASILSSFEKLAEAGQVVEVSDIKRAYEAKAGHRIGKGQIYRVLKRHEWRKIKPRSRHPKKASDEVIEASKKLTLESGS